VLARFERGVLQGVGYKVYYSDGSGVIQGVPDQSLAGAGYADTWRLSCDRSGPPFQCSLARGELALHQTADGTRTLRIGGKPRADTQLLLRVDTQWAVTAPAATGFTAAQTRTLVDQLRAGKSAAIGYHDASVRGVSSRTIPLFGFAQGLEILDNVLVQLNSAPGPR
jgi:invasion protein IalB